MQGLLQKNSGETGIAHINAEANVLTAFLCKADGQRPRAVCDATAIQSIGHGLQ